MLGTPPPDNLALLPSHPPTTSQTTLGAFQSQPQPPARKKKKTQPAAASPAPSDPGSTTGASDPTELITSRADLFSRQRLSISRGPVFIPTVDGSEYYKTDLVGVNRVGFRYIPAGINPPGYIQPCRTIESNPTTYRVSWEDRSPSVKVTKDGLGLAGTAGFRSARCNAPMREGRWYMEVKITNGGGEHVGDESRRDGSHVRLGWGRREAPVNGPVGLDGYSYGYRDKTGEKVTLSHPRPYGRSFGSGDVIGMYISLPARRQADPKDSLDPAHIKRERIPIDLKGQETFEMLEYPQSKEMISLMDYSGKSTSSASHPESCPDRSNSTGGGKQAQPALRPLPTLPNSRISFFVNGESQGIAFEGLYDYLPLRQTDSSRRGKEKKRTREGVKEHRENPFDDGSLGYYPFISLFNEACIRLNPGPEFEFPPPPDIDALLDGKVLDADDAQRNWRPVSERYAEYMQEQWALDELEEEEARAEASRAAAVEKVEAEKQLQRAKRRQQAEERKRAKMAMASEQAARVDEMYLGMNTPTLGAGNVNNGIFTVPSPSPLRCSTAYEDAAMEPQEPPLISNQNVFTFAPDGGQQDLDPSNTILHVKQET
ncbi:COMPASS complex protein [Amanita rubescens]|nr:COMPASS complex protein [Amanita rubescens]